MQIFRRLLLRPLQFAFAFATATTALEAQSLTFGEISGVVTDQAQRPLTDAEVRVRDRSSGAVRWTTTSRDGAYRFAMLPTGRYDVSIEVIGYRPMVHVDVAVSAGQIAKQQSALRTATFPVVAIDTVRASAPVAQPGNWLVERGYADLLGSRRTAADLAALGTTADEHSVEGLPWRYASALVDGVRSTGLQSPRGTGGEAALLAFPVRSVSFAEVGGLGFDVEVGDAGVGVRMTTQRAGGVPTAAAAIEGGTASAGGAFVAGGPLQGDTAQGVIGIDYQRGMLSLPAALGDGAAAAAIVNAAGASHATDLTRYAASEDRVAERIGGFARLDWQPSERLALSMRASGSRLAATGLTERSGLAEGLGTDYEAIAAQAAVNIYGRLSRRISHEFRFSADVGDVSSEADALPLTEFAGHGLSVGGRAGFDESRTTPRGTGMIHLDLGAHQVKTGVSIATHLLDSRYVDGSTGSFSFGDVGDFSAGLGAWRGVDGAVPSQSFRMSETAYFVQDAWRVADGFSVTLGARFDGTRIPTGDIDRNEEWLGLTGIDNRSVDGSRMRLSPRLGFRWELGRAREWLIEGGIGAFQHLPDARDVAQALALDEGATVRLGVGALGSWPTAPTSAVAPTVGRTLTLLGPDFEGPRTQRIGLTLSRRLGAWSSSVAGTYRHTDYLSRRRDLNLGATPAGIDQHGRPLYGALRQVGTLVVAEPGTNRRFSGVDAATVLESTGFSDFWAVTLGLERVRERGLSVSTSYTFSRTTDNVVGLASDARLSPFQQPIAGADWSEGRSDLDIPHRLTVAAEWSAGTHGALRLGAIYRLSSGLPFTPGTRGGVDVNGDGDGANDPAFIDASIPGMTALLAEWDCLRDGSGFAERNSCRGEVSHRLDLRASFRVADLTIGRLDVVVDALDVVSARAGRPDAALLLIDRSGGITTDPFTGVTNLPYLANPSFGRVLADRSPGILWRAGLRIVP